MGDIVLIEDDVKNNFIWKLGKVQRTIPGRDGNVRSHEKRNSERKPKKNY